MSHMKENDHQPSALDCDSLSTSSGSTWGPIFKEKISQAGEAFVKGWGKCLGWPVNDFELDCGLLRIDVMGKLEVWHMSDCKEITMNGETFDNDDLYL